MAIIHVLPKMSIQNTCSYVTYSTVDKNYIICKVLYNHVYEATYKSNFAALLQGVSCSQVQLISTEGQARIMNEMDQSKN